MGPDELYRHLKFVSEWLTRNKIKHWLIYGTLLGAVRNNDIIPYDYDFDFGARLIDTDRILEQNEHIKKHGYVFVRASSYGWDYTNPKKRRPIWRVSFKIVYKGKEVGDIYLYQRFSDGYMRRFDPVSGVYFWPTSTFPAWFTDELIQVRVRDSYFPAPRHPQVLLRHWYGTTWKTPIKAKAQGGNSRDEYDYYGGDKDIKLSFLTEYMRTLGIRLIPFIDHKIKYIYPIEHKQWIEANESQLTVYKNK